MEMASAAGITLVPDSEKNPLLATSYGVGEMINDAIQRGCRNFIIGIGGSVTNDGGIGMLKALGVRFLDENGEDAGEGGQALAKVARIDVSGMNPLLKECHIQVACDVNNPLCGENGSTYVYGPQKGVTEDMKKTLDEAMAHFARVTSETLENDYMNTPGAGAAGGRDALSGLRGCGGESPVPGLGGGPWRRPADRFTGAGGAEDAGAGAASGGAVLCAGWGQDICMTVF